MQPRNNHWACAWGGPSATGYVRAAPEDFLVRESLNHSPDGEGDHVYVHVEKRGVNTQWLAERLARFCRVSQRDVGFAGMKDRNAVTRQWFSVSMPGKVEPDWRLLEIDGVSVLETARHRRKLRRGAITANAFEIAVTGVAGDRERLERQLACVAEEGVPNYFGEQRFGRAGRNVEQALAMFSGRRFSRAKRSVYLSAARAWLFNELLSARVDTETWRRVVAGDVLMLAGSRSVFTAAGELDGLQQRLDRHEIDITGPLAGGGDEMTSGEAAGMEKHVFDDNPRLHRGLVDAGLEADRRPLCLRPRNFTWNLENDRLSLSFELPAGGYATSVLREIVSY